MSFFDDLVASMSGTDAAGLSAVTRRDRRPLDMNAIGAVASAAGDVMGGLSHLQYGLQAQQSAAFQAAQLRQSAGQVQASAQRSAFDVDRQAQYAASTALAAAAASGGGASDPTVVNLIAKNAGEFAYRKAVALYQGEDRARLMNLQADAKDFEGKNIRSNSAMISGSQLFKAATTLMGGQARGASLFQRFGGGGPKGMIDAEAA